MSEFHFSYFRDVKGGAMARVETLGDKPIPLNIHIDNARQMRCLTPGPCRIEVCGIGTEEYPDTGPECPNRGAVVETAGLTFRLIFRAEEQVKKGAVISGVAWLFGDIAED